LDAAGEHKQSREGCVLIRKMKCQGEPAFTETGESYVLEFKSDTTYTLRLDVNNGKGNNLIFEGEGEIVFEPE